MSPVPTMCPEHSFSVPLQLWSGDSFPTVFQQGTRVPGLLVLCCSCLWLCPEPLQMLLRPPVPIRVWTPPAQAQQCHWLLITCILVGWPIAGQHFQISSGCPVAEALLLQQVCLLPSLSFLGPPSALGCQGEFP